MIELKVPAAVEPQILDKMQNRLAKRYPVAQTVNEFNVELEVTGAKIAVNQHGHRRLSTADQSSVVLLKRDGIITARLPIYPGWKVLESEAKENWAAWREFAPGYPISRIGVRFVNRVNIPVDGLEQKMSLEKYFAITPQLPQIEQPLENFVVQAQISTYMPPWKANIAVAPVRPAPAPGHISFILDIDVYREDADIPGAEARLWAATEQAREIKNDLFERLLTDKAKELFRK